MNNKNNLKINKKKLNVLSPEFKKQIGFILKNMENSLSLLYDLATKDEKTGLYNHRFFKTITAMEIEKARRGTPLSLLVIDIDFFKKVNDNYGHLIGDLILEELAIKVQKEVRKYDIVARFGGEEFFILLPATKVKRAFFVAERIRNSLHENKYLKKYKITISIGVTEYKKKDSIKTLIKRADEALYISKKQGRNQTTIK